jgi:hypothetical protein
VPGGFVRLLHQAAALVGLMTGKPPDRAEARRGQAELARRVASTGATEAAASQAR